MKHCNIILIGVRKLGFDQCLLSVELLCGLEQVSKLSFYLYNMGDITSQNVVKIKWNDGKYLAQSKVYNKVLRKQ
jgi:hypothetical protein